MNAPLYTVEILRLAASLPAPVRLPRVDGAAETRSPTCGSVVSTQVVVEDGRITALSQQVSACAFGQASAALVAGHAEGRDAETLAGALRDLQAWLDGKADHPGEWPGLSALAPARSRKGRLGAILLPFRSLLAAMENAR